MSERDQLVLAVGITAIVACASLSFVGWLLWSLFWDAFDYVMQNRKRAKNNRFEGARRHQNYLHVPRWLRDMKGGVR
jgi:hypothetical protein